MSPSEQPEGRELPQPEQKVLLLTSNFPRWEGDSTTPFVLHLAQDLRDIGWSVRALAPHAPRAAIREVVDGIPVDRFRYLLPERQQTVCYQGGALINLRRSPANWLKLPFLVAAEFFATVRRLAAERYSIINAHWILPQGFVAVIAGRLTRTPVILTAHGGDVFDLQGPLFGWFKRFALRHAQAVTVNSSATRAAVLEIVSDLPIHTIPMGVTLGGADQADSATLRTTLCPGDGPLLVFVGRLVIEKGLADVIEALAMISNDLPKARLVALGEGQDRRHFEQLAEKFGVADRITFTGWVDPDDVRGYLAAADIFVGPSKAVRPGWQEGLGLVFLEALEAGTPVIATASGGIADVIAHEVTGLLVAQSAPHEIAAAIRRLRADPDLASRLRTAGRTLVAERFSRQTSAASFDALFTQVITERP